MDNVEDSESVPHLIQYISANGLANFDSIGEIESLSHQKQPDESMFVSKSAREPEAAADPLDLRKVHSVSISMPPSPAGRHFDNPKRVLFCDHDPNLPASNLNDTPRSAPPEPSTAIHPAKYYSQPMPKGAMYLQSENPVNFPKPPRQQQERGSPQPQSGAETPQPLTGRDGRFDSFKTWSGKLERQVTRLSGRPLEPRSSLKRSHRIDRDALPVDRYFDALEGPELDTLKPQEESILPDDKSWPFLLRYTIASFGICLGISSQAILWKTLATTTSTKFLNISLKVNLILWIISVALMVAVSFLYILKLIFYFEAVRREYYHPIRINFFFAPWIALLFLCLGVPPSIAKTLPHALWYVLMAPIFFLELKIYGQWMSGGTRRLSKVANPSNHLSIVGNFVGALLGATMGLKEGPLFFFAVGLAHYIVMFVTLYQRLPTNETLPKDLHPVFFLFVAAPSVASMAWANIQGSFDYGSRIAYFIGIFLYLSLAVRLNFFRGFRFSLAWWAYTFPMTGAAIATIRYSNEVRGWFTRALSIVLCTVSVVMVLALLVATFIHAFVKRNLFPNDNAIAVSDKPPISVSNWFHHNEDGHRDPDDIENYLKFVTRNDKAAEEGVNVAPETSSSESHSIDR